MSKEYKSQSLAIVLVLLIVVSIIGFALYARTIREAERVVDEKSSAEAHELVETAVGLLSTVNYTQLREAEVLGLLDCNINDLLASGCRKYEISLRDLEEIFFTIGLKETDFSGFEQEVGEDFCTTELAIYGLSEEGVVIEQDEAYSVFVDKVDWDNCHNIRFELENLGTSDGFVMSTFYGEYTNGDVTKYKPYEFEDIIGFKYGAGGDNWEAYSSGSPLSFPGDYDVEKEDYALDEVRFKSLGGSSRLYWNSSGSCDVNEHLLVEVGATCGGKYSGKSFILPEEYFAPPMFDYVYFQGQGNLEADIN